MSAVQSIVRGSITMLEHEAMSASRQDILSPSEMLHRQLVKALCSGELSRDRDGTINNLLSHFVITVPSTPILAPSGSAIPKAVPPPRPATPEPALAPTSFVVRKSPTFFDRPIVDCTSTFYYPTDSTAEDTESSDEAETGEERSGTSLPSPKREASPPPAVVNTSDANVTAGPNRDDPEDRLHRSAMSDITSTTTLDATDTVMAETMTLAVKDSAEGTAMINDRIPTPTEGTATQNTSMTVSSQSSGISSQQSPVLSQGTAATEVSDGDGETDLRTITVKPPSDSSTASLTSKSNKRKNSDNSTASPRKRVRGQAPTRATPTRNAKFGPKKYRG
ncbi:hypothetical protein BDV95DRAFT_27853 [Massariosphaeria phaeospora]|uniref:Uncharacterized protein n=1 Tax=Massariosphaeria phaeospora TaxID=100035 RepID=A0A7C8I8C0_9PLEO|nr:hypothetical protein BDV95DRAFT_27853 [Massariosphaeria phaeospora]